MLPRGLDGRLPVFIFPQALTFYTGDQRSLSQIVTIYNPYDFHITFSVLCNNPRCYAVEPSRGVMQPRSTLNMTITRTSLDPPPTPNHDRIRVVISEEGSRTSSGRKDLTATLVEGVPEVHTSSSDSDKFESVHATPSRPGAPPPRTQPFAAYQGARSPSLLLVGGAVVCMAGLLLPTLGEETQSALPPYLHLPASFKMAIAYALGLLTYAILRPL